MAPQFTLIKGPLAQEDAAWIAVAMSYLCLSRIREVVYALYPWFGRQYGPLLPAAEPEIGFLKGLLILTGPGIKKGQRLDRTIWLADIVPTICYLMDFPLPERENWEPWDKHDCAQYAPWSSVIFVQCWGLVFFGRHSA